MDNIKTLLDIVTSIICLATAILSYKSNKEKTKRKKRKRK